MFDRFLVAVDGSEASLHAFRQAIRFAKAQHGHLVVTSVVPPYDGELRLVGVRHINQLMKAPAEQALSKAAEIAAAEGVSVKTVRAEGEPHETIVEVAEQENCNLIVVGVRGASLSEKALMGSMTARVIGYSATDVLVIPFGTIVGFQNVLLAVDGSQSSKDAAMRGFYFAKTYGARLTVVSVAEVPPHIYSIDPRLAEKMIAESREYLDEVASEANGAGVQAEYLVREGEAADILTDLAKDRKEELVILGSHGRTGLKRLLMGSVAERVIGHSPCPVLVVRT